METKQVTAIDWLFKKITQNGEIRWRGTQYRELFEEAKAMEKEQITDAYLELMCDEYGYEVLPQVLIDNAEQYYNETYGK